tara:strand:- start:1300 stop:1533 length:234 start_codon:yes stop_codon:yes gene_type:complete
MQYAAMDLRDYLAKEGLTASQFAERIGRATSTVTRLVRRETRPDWETMRVIREVTDGQVVPNDFDTRRSSTSLGSGL